MAKQRVEPVTEGRKSSTRSAGAPDEGGRRENVPWAQRRGSGGEGSQSNIGSTNPVMLSVSSRRFPMLQIEADSGNTDYIKWGFGPGNETHRLGAGDVWPLWDESPGDISLIANSGTQKARWVGSGDPEP